MGLQAEFYVIELLYAISPLSQGPIFFKSSFKRSEFFPFILEVRPHSQIVTSSLLRFGFNVSQMGWKVNLRCSHQTHRHPQKAAGHPKVGMLAVCFAAFIIGQQIRRAISTDMEGRLNHIIFENMIISFADATGMGLSLRTTGLFNPRHDSGI